MSTQIETNTQELSIINRVCFKCKYNLPIESFYKSSSRKGGHAYICKQCLKNFIKNNYRTIEIKEKKKAYDRNYIKNNYQKIVMRNSIYASNNIEKINIRNKWRYKNTPQYKIARILRARLYNALYVNKTKKTYSTFNLLGCTVEELKTYLENMWLPGMSWDNHTLNGWHIDHIKPVNTFDLTDPEQQKQCFHYTNLRPLWSFDNQTRPKDGSDIKTIQMFNEG